jgi:hypothetical protein
MPDPIFELNSSASGRTPRASLFALVLALAALPSRGQDLPTVAIFPFAGNGIATEDLVDVTDRFDSELRSTQSVKVVNHRDVDKALRDQGLQSCQDDKCLVETGRRLGVRSVYAGAISRSGKTWTVALRRLDVDSSKTTFKHTLDVRGGLDDLLDKGCLELASIAVGDKKTASDHTVLVSRSPLIWPWIAGGAVLVAGGITAAILLLSDDSSSGTATSRSVSIAWNPNP